MRRYGQNLALGYIGLVILLMATATVAEARQPTDAEMDRVLDLVLQLEVDTDDAYVEAIHAEKQGDQKEEEALRRLYTLKESASYFREQVQVSYEAPEHTVVAFDRLNADFIEAREEISHLHAYGEYRELFETIEDTIGNLRYYYVAPDEYTAYADYEVYPYYPGFQLFVHVYTPANPFRFRHVGRWHLHPDYYKRYPYRSNYKFGYSRFSEHYSSHAKHTWHKKVVKSSPKYKRVPIKEKSQKRSR